MQVDPVARMKRKRNAGGLGRAAMVGQTANPDCAALHPSYGLQVASFKMLL